MKLVVINSVGPMGSSVISALLEKYNLINLPLRKTYVSEYVTGKIKLNNNKYKNKMIELLNYMSKELALGGASVLKRQDYKPLNRFKINKKEIKKFKNKKFKSFKEMYFYALNLANNSTIYKKKLTKVLGSTELAVDCYKYKMSDLEKGYKKKFKNVVFINCNRSFEGWINTLCAVRFVKKKLFLKYLKFNIYKWKKVYLNYQKNLNSSSGIIINFDDIFLPNFNSTKIKIEKYLKLKKISLKKIKKLNYDLYGYEISFSEAFNKYDDKNLVLNKFSICILKYYKKLKFNIFFDTFFVLLFCLMFYFDFLRFKLKIK